MRTKEAVATRILELCKEKNIDINTLANTSMTESASKEKQDEALAFGNAGGMCFSFNHHKGFEHYFVVGTEEGKIYL